MFGLLQEPPARRSRSLTISNDQELIELPHHRNRYTPQPPTTARGTYPQNFNSPQAPLFSTADGIFRFRGGYTRSICMLHLYVPSVCFMCMFYVYVLCVCSICMLHLYASCVCFRFVLSVYSGVMKAQASVVRASAFTGPSSTSAGAGGLSKVHQWPSRSTFWEVCRRSCTGASSWPGTRSEN
jgi:hypothetical protein